MLHLKVVLSLLTLLQLAVAYYPWFPPYRCILDHTCIESKREVQTEIDIRTDSLKIIQRLPENGLPHAEQVQALAARLTDKYQVKHRSARVYTSESEVKKDEESIAKRATNTYPVVTAATPTQTNSAAIDQDGTDYSYFAQVLLGSANKPLYMLLDSGAGQSWVMGSTCTSAACMTHNSFGPSDSTTFKSIDGASFDLEYGSGSVGGTMANDSLSIAGLTLPMTLGIANTTSDDFSAFPMDGILGLSQAAGTYPNFIQTLVASKALKSNLFGVSINRNKDGPNTGEISFGAPDTSKYSGTLDYTALSSNAEGDWAIPMDGTGLVGKDAGITGRLAYLDTGTSYIFAPADDVTQFHSIVPGSKSSDGAIWTVPCSTTTPLTFTFSGVTYTVPTEDWVGPMANGACTSNIYGHPVVEGEWLLGDTFLKNVYTVFDVDGNRVGLVPKSGSSAATSSGTASSTGGNPSSPSSSTAPPSAGTASVSGNTDSSPQTSSNLGPTGSSSGSPTTQTASTTGQGTSSETGTPGLNGHQTSDASGNVAAESSSAPTASPTKKSASAHLELNLPTMLLIALALALVS